jgi:hypothetical protein
MNNGKVKQKDPKPLALGVIWKMSALLAESAAGKLAWLKQCPPGF